MTVRGILGQKVGSYNFQTRQMQTSYKEDGYSEFQFPPKFSPMWDFSPKFYIFERKYITRRKFSNGKIWGIKGLKAGPARQLVDQWLEYFY